MAYKQRKANYGLYETTRFDNIRTMVENAAKRFPDRKAFVYRNNPSDPEPSYYTFSESQKIVRELTTKLLEMGLRGKKIAVTGEQLPGWAFAYYAAACASAVSVPIDKDLPEDDIISILNTSECEAIFFSHSAGAKIDSICRKVPSIKHYILINPKDDKPLKIDNIQEMTTLEELCKQGEELVDTGDDSYYTNEIDNEALFSIVFTSGTTGKGKGVMLSQKNICSDMEYGMYNFQLTYKTVCVLPLHHTFGSVVNIVGHYSQGCEIYLTSGLRYISKEIKEFQPSHLILVPLFVESFYKKIMNSAEDSGKLSSLKKMISFSNKLRKVGIDLRSVLFKSVLSSFGGKLEMIICGGAALNPDIINFFDSIGITVLNGYGITECSPLISCNRNEYRKEGSVGLPIIGGKVKIIDPDENGEGEIAYKGPNVMLGYYNDEEATKAVIDDEGYFHTGDYGKILNEGSDQWIYITGRLKNLIILSNGKNVYPEEIETDIQGVYGVNEVVVYAGNSKSNPGKEVIVAEIFPDFERLEEHGIGKDKIQKYFEDEIHKINKKNISYKSIGKVKLRYEEFPKNTSKKITRFAISKDID